ncbi:serine protease snake [Drosophila serrata]|uniref:serine protease snake n=1 Tax=Drosophila serrata TaxID=7274 RepID=UPI000A1CFEAE|nr:serine protease snake [Drosophila serrata]
MALSLALFLFFGLCYLAAFEAAHPPPPRGQPGLPEKSSIYFPVEKDILFPDSDNGSNESSEKMWYHINDFRYGGEENRPKPKPKHHPPPPKPGQPFPPPPWGFKKKKNQRRRICEEKYSQYVEQIFPNDTAVAADANDADFDGRILVRPGEYPHMAAVGFEAGGGQVEYKCGGSLISENFVLTAAHCTSIYDLAPKWVRIGDLNLVAEERNVEPQLMRIQEIITHPDYNKDFYYYDIALLKLESKVELTVYVRPIRLWIYSELPTTIAFAMGYGATSFTKPMTNRLTNLNLTIVPNAECNQELPALAETPNGVLDSQICGQDYNLNRDTCQGDSGGPLQLNLPGRRRRHRIHYHLIGITSYGVFCRSNYPSVYTRVSFYLDWIEQTTWSND